MAKAKVKTNALRLLDQKKVVYDYLEYDVADGHIDGVSVAHKVNKQVEEVFKTLIIQGKSKNCYVCVIPVDKELDFKKVSALTGEKKVDMLPVADLLKTTGYVRGGCSPLGMKKLFKTYIHDTAKGLNKMTVSAGKIGLQVELEPTILVQVIHGEFADIVVD